MVNESLGTPLDRYASVGQYMLGDDVVNCSFADMVEDMSRVDWNSSAAEGGKWAGSSDDWEGCGICGMTVLFIELCVYVCVCVCVCVIG